MSNPLISISEKIAGKVIPEILEKAQGFIYSKEEKAKNEIELKKIISGAIVSQLEIEQKDKDSARRREVEVSSSQYSTKLAKNIVPIIALMVLSGSFIMFGIAMFIEYSDPAKKDIVMFTAGGMTGFSFSVISYYFGGLHKNKNEVI